MLPYEDTDLAQLVVILLLCRVTQTLNTVSALVIVNQLATSLSYAPLQGKQLPSPLNAGAVRKMLP